MLLIVVLVLAEVTLRHLVGEVVQGLAVDVVFAVQVVLLEELMHHERHGLVIAGEDLAESKDIEIDVLKVFHRRFKQIGPQVE